MQVCNRPSFLYDDFGFFGRSELNFSDNATGGEPTISSGFLGLSDSLDRLESASSFGSGRLQQDTWEASQGPFAQPDSMNQLSVGSKNVSDSDNHSNHQRDHNQHGDPNKPLRVEDSSGKLVTEDNILHLNQIMSCSSINNHNIRHGHGSMIDHISIGVRAGERSLQVETRNGVTLQWEESLQDLQSLLAHHGQQHSQIVDIGLPMTPDQGTAAFVNGRGIRTAGGYDFEKGHAGSNTRRYSNTTFPAAAADSELLSFLHFPRPYSSSLQQSKQILQAPAGPVSPYPANPGFRKGSGSAVNSSANTLIQSPAGLYSSSELAQNSSSFLYTRSSPVASNYFNVNPAGGPGSPNSFMNHANVPMIQKQLMRAPSIIDLERARDHSSVDHMNGLGAASSSGGAARPAARLSSSFFDAKRRGSEGSPFLSGKGRSEPARTNHFATERQRREHLNEKYETLRSLVPNPSKTDRASIVADAIEYVKELKRSVQELQMLVEDKRKEVSLKQVGAQYCSGNKRRRDIGDSNVESTAGGQPGANIWSPLRRSFSFNEGKSRMTDPLSDVFHLRNSWLQRTSQTTGTHVDVRIIHDEVTIKVTQRRRKQGRQMLLHAMMTLHELHLDLQHANGASIGEHNVYIFNSKILERSSIFAGYVVTKFLEAVDRDCPPQLLSL